MFDKEVILELIDLSKDTDPTMLDQIVNNFSLSAPNLIAEIKAAHAQNNLNAVEKAAHKLKGSSGILGLLDLSQKSNEVMVAARRKELKDFAKDIQELNSIFQTSFVELKSFISQNRVE